MNTKDTRSAWLLVGALPRYHPPFGSAYIAALRTAGYDNEAIQDDYRAYIRDEPTHEAFLVAMVRRAREVRKQ